MVTWRRAGFLALLLLVVAQLGRCEMDNPAEDPALSVLADASVTPEVGAILGRSCFDCHSSDTRWPAYAGVAPLSWVIWYDVDRARRYLNLSRFGRYRPDRALVWVSTVCDAVRTGRMPLPRYVWTHSGARLSDGDRDRLCEWATAVERDLRKRAASGQAPTS